jgi:hypothetical protein
MNRMVLLGAIACAMSPGFAHIVRVDFDHAIHFSCYKTYQWVKAPDVSSQDPVFPNRLMQERIAGFIDEAMAARGLKRVTKGGDLLVSYRVDVTSQPVFTTISDGIGPGWGWGPGWDWGPGPGWAWGWGSGFSTTTVQNIYEGTLVVNMVDANRRQLVFQGTSTQTVSSRPERNSRRLLRAVNSVFEKFPPRP